MKLQKLICVGFSGSELTDQDWAKVDALVEKRELLPSDSEIDKHTDADAMWVRLGCKVGKDIIDQLPNLKYIGMLGTGYGGIDTKYAASKGITVTNIADYATEAVAEFTFGAIIEHYRDIARARTQAEAGNFGDDFSGGEIKGRKFGVVGLGNIGRRTAELAQAFGTEVVYWSRNRKEAAEKAGIKYVELDELFASCNIITINLSLNPETEEIIDAELLSNIKPYTLLVNLSPMELLDFDALIGTMEKNHVTLIFDHTDEVTQDQIDALQSPLSCIFYPPIAYLTGEATKLKYRIYIDNVKNYLDDKPTNKVD